MKHCIYTAIVLALSVSLASCDSPKDNKSTKKPDSPAGTESGGDISKWDVSRVTTMGAMFYGAKAFNGDISTWNVSAVTNMRSMFYGAKAFNKDISTWTVSVVTDMSNMFTGAIKFNSDISGWQVQKVENMEFMFLGATAFKQNLNDWGIRLHISLKGSFIRRQSMFKNSGLKDSLPDWCKDTHCKN